MPTYKYFWIILILCAVPVFSFSQITDPHFPNPTLKARKTDTRDSLNSGLPRTGNPGVNNSGVAPSTKSNKQSSTDDGWEFTVAPYFFMSGIDGKVGARGRLVNINTDFGNIWDRLDFGVMGAFQARKGRFLITNDLQWIKLSADRVWSGSVAYRSTSVTSKMFILDPEVGYRMLSGKAGNLDLTGGVRIWSVKNELETTSANLIGFNASQRKTWAAPVIGVNGTLNLSKAFYLSTRMDIGGGIGADTTSQFYAGAGVRFSPSFALTGGWRYQQVKYDDDTGFVFDTRMQGPLFGARFTFR